MGDDIRFNYLKPQPLTYHVEQGRDWRPLTGRFSRLFNDRLKRLWHRFSQPHPAKQTDFKTATVSVETIRQLAFEVVTDRMLRACFDRGDATLICGPRQLRILDNEMFTVAKFESGVWCGVFDGSQVREKYLGIDVLCLPWVDAAIIVPGRLEYRSGPDV